MIRDEVECFITDEEWYPVLTLKEGKPKDGSKTLTIDRKTWVTWQAAFRLFNEVQQEIWQHSGRKGGDDE